MVFTEKFPGLKSMMMHGLANPKLKKQNCRHNPKTLCIYTSNTSNTSNHLRLSFPSQEFKAYTFFAMAQVQRQIFTGSHSFKRWQATWPVVPSDVSGPIFRINLLKSRDCFTYHQD